MISGDFMDSYVTFEILKFSPEFELLFYMVLGFLFFLRTYDKSYKELNLIPYLKVVFKTLIIPILGFGFIHQILKILVFSVSWFDLFFKRAY